MYLLVGKFVPFSVDLLSGGMMCKKAYLYLKNSANAEHGGTFTKCVTSPYIRNHEYFTNTKYESAH